MFVSFVMGFLFVYVGKGLGTVAVCSHMREINFYQPSIATFNELE